MSPVERGNPQNQEVTRARQGEPFKIKPDLTVEKDPLEEIHVPIEIEGLGPGYILISDFSDRTVLNYIEEEFPGKPFRSPFGEIKVGYSITRDGASEFPSSDVLRIGVVFPFVNEREARRIKCWLKCGEETFKADVFLSDDVGTDEVNMMCTTWIDPKDNQEVILIFPADPQVFEKLEFIITASEKEN